jgi:uncharacterized membrane protein (UPF0127 family)
MKIKVKGREIEVKKVSGFFGKALGLMFRKKSLPLLFYFGGDGIYAIHSFFCKRFYAIWFLDGKIIDEKLIEPWKISIKPAEKFDKLLEIPSGSSDFLSFSTERKV